MEKLCELMFIHDVWETISLINVELRYLGKANVANEANINTAINAEVLLLIAASLNGDLKHKRELWLKYENKTFYFFICTGDVQVASLIIQNGVNINEAIDGETALHAAAAAGILIVW